MDWMIWVWLGIFVVAIIIEAVTEDMVSIWFAGGALVALILSVVPAINNNCWWVEIIAFFAVAFALLLPLRPLVLNYMIRNEVKSNVDEIIGKKATVTKDITELNYGEVKLNGIIWTGELPSDEKETIKQGEIVVVLAINGNKLIVTKLNLEEK